MFRIILRPPFSRSAKSIVRYTRASCAGTAHLWQLQKSFSGIRLQAYTRPTRITRCLAGTGIKTERSLLNGGRPFMRHRRLSARDSTALWPLLQILMCIIPFLIILSSTKFVLVAIDAQKQLTDRAYSSHGSVVDCGLLPVRSCHPLCSSAIFPCHSHEFSR
jgi:hypothetical protein